MNNCDIFNKSFFKDTDISSFQINIDTLSSLIPAYSVEYSGIWLPIVINNQQSDIGYVNILGRAESNISFDPCNCISVPPVETGTYIRGPEDESLNCSYCGSHGGVGWSLTNLLTGNKIGLGTSCCDGACDIRMTKDDYLAKIPVLNNAYLTKFYDWKYKLQFPACSNKGLGYEKFIQAAPNNIRSFKKSPEIRIDWNIKERISEIKPENDIDTYHKDMDTHRKSYHRSKLTSKTCGNFILTKLNPNSNNPTYPLFNNLVGDLDEVEDYSEILPDPEQFTPPYGFQNQDHYNIFVKNKKRGSFWKWNYGSGILCWYRYFNIGSENDDRIIKDVDLYISDGDVFYATNDGPEIESSSEDEDSNSNNTNIPIQTCPSGLKLIDIATSSVTGIIPNDSEFLYISSNIYPKFRSIIDRLEQLENELQISSTNKISPINKLKLSALLATGPNYHEVTIDLLKTVVDVTDSANDYPRDMYIKIFNSGMLIKDQYSANQLNIVKTNDDLTNTLVNKYGCYLWVPPHSNLDLELNKECDSHCYIDLDFEPVVKLSDTTFSRSCTATSSCAQSTVDRNFTYDQKISINNLMFNTQTDKRYQYQTCNSGNFTLDKSIDVISAYFNNTLIQEQTYGSGCSVFYQKYIRPPSYEAALLSSYIGEIVGEKLCSGLNFCNKELAIKYNKKEGSFIDESLILERKYPANYCNINIDRIGFHRDGGLYYDSNNLGSGQVVFSTSSSNTSSSNSIKINFTTKDVGIKLYNIYIGHLRDNDHPQCKTFPIDQSCKCFPLSTSVTGYKYNCDGSLLFTNENNVLYTPNLSTKLSPKIKSYGGFSNNELDLLVGNQRMPDHPVVGSLLANLDRKINPLSPYGCAKEVSITLPNYVYTRWLLGLNNYSTHHADIWMKVISYVDVTNRFFKRYTIKATVNGKDIYTNQQTPVFEKDSNVSTFNIELTNPFLDALLAQSPNPVANKNLYTNLQCSSDTVNRDYYYDNVQIIFKQIPRKQVLNYVLSPISKMGTLGKSFFHPNSGIIESSDYNVTSLIIDKNLSTDFNYEKDLFGQSSYSDKGVMFSGFLSPFVKNILGQTDKLLDHKKLRLYIKYENFWYEYLNPHTLGFYNTHNNNTYPGFPAYFEYTKEDKYKTQLNISQHVNLGTSSAPSPLIPVSAKNNTEFLYFNNIFPTGLKSHNLSTQKYPILLNEFYAYKNAKNKIIIKGSRPYFLLKEQDPAISVDSISSMPQDIQNLISDNTIIIENIDKRWRYRGRGLPKNSESSYELIPSRNYIDENFNELFIEYLDSDRDGYVNNTRIDTKIGQIKLIDKNKNTVNYTFNVKNKALYAKKLNKKNQHISFFDNNNQNQYLDIFTILELDLCSNCVLPLKEGISYLTGFEDSSYSAQSFTILQNFKNLLKSEPDSLLHNQYYDTKWGDLINFDNRLIQDINNSPYFNNKLNEFYPKSIYDNILYHISINSCNDDHFYGLVTYPGGSQVINYPQDLIYYNIHQKYNIGFDHYVEQGALDEYKNFLPFIDINFLEEDMLPSNFRDSLRINFSNNQISTGLMYISGIRSFVDIKDLDIDPVESSIFFVSLNKDTKLKPVLFNQRFYNDTLRVDYPYYRLASINYSIDENIDGCGSVFRSKTPQTTQFNHYFDTQKFDFSELYQEVFNTLPIYCDTDRAGQLCGNASCSIKTIGETKLLAEYESYKYNYITVEDIIDQDTIDFAFSVDEGLYNPIGSGALPYIQRFEIPPDSNLYKDISLDNTTNCIIDFNHRPPYQQKYIDTEYQNKLTSYILSESDKGDLVKNSDILANEMLFRLLYGSKQNIELDSIKKKTSSDLMKDTNKKSLSYILQYSEPRITPEYIYDLIPYDYDIDAYTSNRKVSGTIKIDGVLSVGARTEVNIGGSLISIIIRNSNGKITVIASCGGKEYASEILDTRPTTTSVTAVPRGSPVYAPNNNTTVTKITTCDGGVTPLSWSKGKYFTSGKVTEVDPETGEETEFSFLPEFKKCIAKYGAGCLYADDIDPRVTSIDIDYRFPAGGLCPVLCTYCDSRGMAIKDDPSTWGGLSPNCKIVDSTNNEVSMGGVGRGVFSPESCAARQTSIRIGNVRRAGDLDSYAGGVPILNHGGISNCSPKTVSCGRCLPLGSKDNYGGLFDPLRFYGAGTEPCECQSYSYGPCTITDNSCQCKRYAKGFPKIFSYNFENCDYTFNNMKGHVYTLEGGEPLVSDGVRHYSGCERSLQSPNIGKQDFSANEECYWVECRGSTPTDWDIYKIESSSSVEYTPLCASELCYITYDNNTINIRLAGNKTGCFDVNIRNNCPTISIRLPNNTFTFTDSINSECTECDVNDNKVLMTPAENPEWNIITETRTAVLGYLPIEGDKNKNLMRGGGAAYQLPGICYFTDNICCDDTCDLPVVGFLQCGQSAPNSWPWNHAMVCHLEGSASPDFAPCISEWAVQLGTSRSYVTNINGGVPFAIGSDNDEIKSRHINYWKEIMTSSYYDAAPCHNNYGLFDVNDLVEGVVPGSCSPLRFQRLNYPMVAFRQTLGGGTIQEGNFGVHIAYFTYQYKRPRTIQDVFLGPNASKCSTIKQTYPPSSYNIKEKYAVQDCQSSISCYDSTVAPCTPGNVCCELNRVNSNIRAKGL
jgi:hypothetical protein